MSDISARILAFVLIGFCNFIVSLYSFISFNLNLQEPLSEQFWRFILSVLLVAIFNWWILKDVIQ